MTSSLVPRLSGAAPHGLPGLRAVVRSGLGRAFGPPPFDPEAAPGDPGLFGPGSASWDVIAEPAAIVGGIRALIVQLLHPLAMAGVADHSRFRDDPLGRLQRTSAWVTTSTFGSTHEALQAARAVRRVHRRVVGVASDGRPYRADEPRLLAWVGIALTSSFLATDRAYAPRPLRGERADAFVAEQAKAAALLDPRVDLDGLAADPDALAALRAGTLRLPLLDDGTLPQDVAALQAVLASFDDELSLTAQAAEALRFLRRPPIPSVLKAGYVPLAAAAIATLEPRQRQLLGLAESRLAASALAAQGRLTVAALRLAAGPSPSSRAAQRRAERRERNGNALHP